MRQCFGPVYTEGWIAPDNCDDHFKWVNCAVCKFQFSNVKFYNK